jgi:outer membrane receptor protein involved in Fe transport
MRNTHLLRLTLTTAIIAAFPQLVLAADAADAQNAPPTSPATAGSASSATNKQQAAAQSNTTSLQGIVVTGSATGVKKIDASYQITAANLEQIKESNPISTADILKISPGIWPESSGGQTGDNIEIAGFPGGGDAPFFTNMVQGSPLYGMSSLSFMDSSSLLRLDDTIQRVEIVQTGPGVLYGAGQMGATANFILRQGSAEPTGSVGVTYGDEGLLRIDGFYGFKLADDWYASIGGFWRESDGVRNPQFKSDSGGQLTATFTHDFDSGSIMLWARKLDDKNQFIVPVPFLEDASSNFSQYPGFNGLTDTYGSHAIQHVTLINPAGGTEQADLAKIIAA